MNQAPVFTPLPYVHLRVVGPDASRFLQGQTSCDVEALGDQEVRFGTVNTPKGRMVALFRIQRWQDGFLLRLHESQLEGLMAHLNKYKVFFKCELEKAPEIAAYGLVSDDFPDLEQDTWQDYAGGRLQRLPTETPVLEWLSETPPEQINNEASPSWLMKACKAGLPELFAESSDTFILQYLNLHELGAVSFSKGCYTGQEIIARMKYLGKLKKRMFVFEGGFTLDTPAPTPGSAIYFDDGSKAGELVQIQGNNTLGWVAQAVCALDLPEQNRKVNLLPDSDTPLHLI
ncbi:MAG: hypothetical protein R3183_03245 [Oleiphilaceae bacterium]|nr:hypothetical protein [Oleiphilaceae bacterium]